MISFEWKVIIIDTLGIEWKCKGKSYHELCLHENRNENKYRTFFVKRRKNDREKKEKKKFDLHGSEIEKIIFFSDNYWVESWLSFFAVPCSCQYLPLHETLEILADQIWIHQVIGKISDPI